jgi:hypothetical protein
MSTFLQLANELASEAGVSGAASSISAVTNQTGQALRLVNWIKRSWTEIQRRHNNWRWMRSKFTFNTVAGTDAYAYGSITDSRLSGLITRFARWLPFDDSGAQNVKRYLTSGGVSGEIWMTNLPYDYFQAVYKRGQQNNGPIVHITIDPQNQWVIGPKPDGIYTVSGEYMMSAQVLAADGDVPEMPSDFHDLIVYRAMEKYGRFYAAGEVLARGEREGGRLMAQLVADQLPSIALGAPLA